jgi:thioredoxin 1
MLNSTNDQDFTKDVLKSQNLVLVDFWAQWCAPCKQLTPIISELAGEFAGKIEFFKLNIEENPEAPTKYEVRGIPNLILFKDGQAVDSKVGSLPKAALKEWLDSHI